MKTTIADAAPLAIRRFCAPMGLQKFAVLLLGLLGGPEKGHKKTTWGFSLGPLLKGIAHTCRHLVLNEEEAIAGPDRVSPRGFVQTRKHQLIPTLSPPLGRRRVSQPREEGRRDG